MDGKWRKNLRTEALVIKDWPLEKGVSYNWTVWVVKAGSVSLFSFCFDLGLGILIQHCMILESCGRGVQHFRSLSSRRKICQLLGLVGELFTMGGLWLFGRDGGKVSFLTIACQSKTCLTISLDLGMLLKLH